MRLSEAIRLGSMLKPQAFGTSQSIEQHKRQGDVLGLSERVTGTCALAAAIEAGGCPIKTTISAGDVSSARGPAIKAGDTVRVVEMPNEWLALLHSTATCPQCFAAGVRHRDFVHRLIAHLNDDHELSREAIAEWVEGLEGLVALRREPDAPAPRGESALRSVMKQIYELNELARRIDEGEAFP